MTLTMLRKLILYDKLEGVIYDKEEQRGKKDSKLRESCYKGKAALQSDLGPKHIPQTCRCGPLLHMAILYKSFFCIQESGFIMPNFCYKI